MEYAQSRLLLLLLAPRRRQASRSLENSHNWGGAQSSMSTSFVCFKVSKKWTVKGQIPFFFLGKEWESSGVTDNQSLGHSPTHTHTQRETPARGGKDTKHRKSHMYGGTTSDWAHDTRLSLSICYCLFLFVFCFLARREKKGKSLSREMEAQRLSKCPVASTTNR